MPTSSPAHTHDARSRQPKFTMSPPDTAARRLVEWLGDVSTEHILVCGGKGLDLVCALCRAGAAETTLLCSHERSERQSASLVIVPNISSPDWLASALPRIRRTLVPTGRLVLNIGPQVAYELANRIRHLLVLHGFSAIRVGHIGDNLVISADVPAFHIRLVS